MSRYAAGPCTSQQPLGGVRAAAPAERGGDRMPLREALELAVGLQPQELIADRRHEVAVALVELGLEEVHGR